MRGWEPKLTRMISSGPTIGAARDLAFTPFYLDSILPGTEPRALVQVAKSGRRLIESRDFAKAMLSSVSNS